MADSINLDQNIVFTSSQVSNFVVTVTKLHNSARRRRRLPALLQQLARSPPSSTIPSVHCHTKSTIRSVRLPRRHPDGVTLTPRGVCWTIPCRPQPRRESRWGAVTLDPRQPILVNSSCYGQLRSIRTWRRALIRSAAVTIMNSFMVSRIDSRLLLQSKRGLQSAAIRQAVTHLELRRSSHIWRQTRRPRHSSAARRPALAPYQRANNVQVVSAGVQGHTWSRTILHRWRVHPSHHHVNTTIDALARPVAATSWCQGCESSSATGHSRWPAQKCGTACQSTSGHPKLSLHSRVA